jgi:hypothetical protein
MADIYVCRLFMSRRWDRMVPMHRPPLLKSLTTSNEEPSNSNRARTLATTPILPKAQACGADEVLVDINSLDPSTRNFYEKCSLDITQQQDRSS